MAFDKKILEQSVGDLERSVQNLKLLQQIVDSAQFSEKQMAELCENLNTRTESIRKSVEKAEETIRTASEANAALLKKANETLEQTGSTVENSSASLGSRMEKLGADASAERAELGEQAEQNRAAVENRLQGVQEALDTAVSATKTLISSGNGETKKQIESLGSRIEELGAEASAARTGLGEQVEQSREALEKKHQDTQTLVSSGNGETKKQIESLGSRIEELGAEASAARTGLREQAEQNRAAQAKKLEAIEITIQSSASDVRVPVINRIAEMENKTGSDFADVKKRQKEIIQSIKILNGEVSSVRDEIKTLNDMLRSNSAKTLAAMLFSAVAAVAAIIGLFL